MREINRDLKEAIAAALQKAEDAGEVVITSASTSLAAKIAEAVQAVYSGGVLGEKIRAIVSL